MSICINENLKDKVIVITGAGGILCGSWARELVRHGAKLALLDLNGENVKKFSQELNNSGADTIGVECDVLKIDSVKAAKKIILNHFGHMDGLINGAGGNNPKATTSHDYYSPEDVKDSNVKSFFDMDPSGFGFVFDLNFIGTFIPTQIFTDELLHKDAFIINVSSASAAHSVTRVPAYSAAKAAVVNFTEWMATHFAKTGLRVNAIEPGFFLTKQNEKLLLDEKGEWTERTKKILAGTPMDRLGTTDDLLGTIVFLADSKMSGFITGSTIRVDGGFGCYLGV